MPNLFDKSSFSTINPPAPEPIERQKPGIGNLFGWIR